MSRSTAVISEHKHKQQCGMVMGDTVGFGPEGGIGWDLDRHTASQDIWHGMAWRKMLGLVESVRASIGDICHGMP